jgi:hypothetical protein
MAAENPFEGLLRALAAEVARAVVSELRAGEAPGMVDQAASPLGRRRHIAAVRRLVNAGAPGAAIVGRRYLLARDALDAELGCGTKPAKRPRKTEPAAATDELAALRERYGLQRTPKARAS